MQARDVYAQYPNLGKLARDFQHKVVELVGDQMDVPTGYCAECVGFGFGIFDQHPEPDDPGLRLPMHRDDLGHLTCLTTYASCTSNSTDHPRSHSGRVC